jgi:hypothetical protein
MYYWEEMVLSNNPIGRALEGLEWHGLQNLVVLDLSSMGLTCEIPKFIWISGSKSADLSRVDVAKQMSSF